jgi:hypothetical protein
MSIEGEVSLPLETSNESEGLQDELLKINRVEQTNQ